MQGVKLLDGTSSVITREGMLHPYNGLDEIRHKYVRPLPVRELTRRGVVSILDVGFGVGMVSALVTDEIWRTNDKCRISIDAIEKSRFIVEMAGSCRADIGSYNILRHVLSRELCQRSGVQLSETSKAEVQEGRLSLRLYLAKVEDLEFEDEKYDLAIYDLYDPRISSAGWSIRTLSRIWKSLRVGGRFITHTADAGVRMKLGQAGFMWDETKPEGRLGIGTVAWKV